MFAELQLATSVLTAALRSQIRALLPPIEARFSYEGKISVVDHIIVEPGTTMWITRKSIPTPVTLRHPTPDGFATTTVVACRIHITQMIDVVIAAIDDLKAANENPLPAASYKHVRIPVHFDLIAGRAPSGVPQLCVHFVGLGTDVPLPFDLASRIRDSCSALDVSGLKDLLGYSPRVSNLGLSMDNDGTFVAFRLELGTPVPDTVARWSAFWDGELTNQLGTDLQWMLSLDAETVTPAIERRVRDSILGAKELDLKTYPTVMLGDRGDGALTVDMRFGGDVDAKLCTVSVDVTARGTIALSGDKMLVETTASYDADDWDLVKCAFSAAVIGFMDGFVIGGVFGGWSGAIAGGIIGATIGLLTPFAFALLYKPSLPDPKDKACEKVGDLSYRCAYPGLAAIDAGPLGMFTPKVLRSPDGGILFGGTTEVRERAPALLSIVTSGFAFGFIDVCGADPMRNWADLSITNRGSIGLVSAHLQAEDDPDRVFSALPADPSPLLAGSFVQWKLLCSMDKGYLARAEHYPAHLLLVTNGGARYLTIAGPSTPTEEEIAALKLALELAREVRCTRPAREVFEGLGTSLEWLGDPAPPRGFPGGDPPEGPWTHGWHVEVGGAGPWAELVIEDRHGNPLATSSLDAGFGEVTIGVAATELRARLVGRSNALPLAHAAGRSLSVGQALFEHVGELQLSDRCVGLSVRSSARGMLLEAATTAGVLHYDVSDPLAMRLVSANVEQPPRDELHVGEHASHGTPMLLPNRRGRRLAFVRRPRGGGVLVDISVPNQPVLRARYEVTPWHVGLVRVGTQYARLDDTQHRIVFYQRRWTSQPVVAMANA